MSIATCVALEVAQLLSTTDSARLLRLGATLDLMDFLE